MNVHVFETIPLSPTKIYANLRFSTPTVDLLLINLQDENAKIENLYLTSQLEQQFFSWKENLHVGLQIWTPSRIKLVMVITPAYDCNNPPLKEMFRCDVRGYGSKVCIENHYKCDGWTNCINGNKDESLLTCQSQFVYHILLPSVIISFSIFILGFVLMKVAPCLMQQRRIFLLRRSRTAIGTIDQTFNTLFSAPFHRDLGFPGHASMANLTPDNIPQSPPMYRNIYQTNVGEQQLPPSYSEETDIGVFPVFFKRFFGKRRPRFDLESKTLINGTDTARKILDSQSESNVDFQYMCNQNEDAELSTTISGTMASVISTEVFSKVPLTVNKDVIDDNSH